MSKAVAATHRPVPPSFAVVIPVRTRSTGFSTCVEAVTAVLAGIPNRTELMVVDDGSNDLTVARLLAFEAEYPSLSVIRQAPTNRATAPPSEPARSRRRSGASTTSFLWIAISPTIPAYLADFAECMADGSDVVKASRYVRGGGVQGVPCWRVGLSVVGNTVARLCLFRLPIHDCTNGFRAVQPICLHQSIFGRMDLL